MLGRNYGLNAATVKDTVIPDPDTVNSVDPVI